MCDSKNKSKPEITIDYVDVIPEGYKRHMAEFVEACRELANETDHTYKSLIDDEARAEIEAWQAEQLRLNSHDTPSEQSDVFDDSNIKFDSTDKNESRPSDSIYRAW